MRWVDVRECLPDTADRVLVARYVRAVKPVIAVGQCHGTYWIVDEYSRPVRLNEVQYWAPIPAIPHERKAEREEKHYD